jgi:hypothetical protein
LSSVGIVLQLLVIAALLRGGIRKYRVLFVYVVVLFLTTVMEAASFYSPSVLIGRSYYYWSFDAVRQALIYLIVLSFIDQALPRIRSGLPVRQFLWGGAALFAAGSLILTREPVLGRWMTDLSRNLGFLAVVLNMVLWAVLLKSRQGDRLLLMVTGGMGIQMAGKAIGHSLRQLSRSGIAMGDLILVLSHLLCLYIWWQAFRRFDPGATPSLE